MCEEQTNTTGTRDRTGLGHIGCPVCLESRAPHDASPIAGLAGLGCANVRIRLAKPGWPEQQSACCKEAGGWPGS